MSDGFELEQLTSTVSVSGHAVPARLRRAACRCCRKRWCAAARIQHLREQLRGGCLSICAIIGNDGDITERQPNSSSPIVSIFREEKFAANSDRIDADSGRNHMKRNLAGRGTATHLHSAHAGLIVDFNKVFPPRCPKRCIRPRRSRSAAVPAGRPSTATFTLVFHDLPQLQGRQSRSAKIADRIRTGR
jgi:hypothetical protein